MQPDVQLPVFVSQMPFAPVHCVLSVHSTQTFVVRLQTGFEVPSQRSSFSASHSTQSPFGRHAGSVEVGHAAVESVPKSPLHGTHWFERRLHTGVVPEQSALVRQPGTQTLFRQIGLRGVHAEVLSAVHSRHAPLTHAGFAWVGHARDAVVPKSPLQPTHSPPTQTGTPSGQVWPVPQL